MSTILQQIDHPIHHFVHIFLIYSGKEQPVSWKWVAEFVPFENTVLYSWGRVGTTKSLSGMHRLRTTFTRSRTPTGAEMKTQSSLEVPKQVGPQHPHCDKFLQCSRFVSFVRSLIYSMYCFFDVYDLVFIPKNENLLNLFIINSFGNICTYLLFFDSVVFDVVHFIFFLSSDNSIEKLNLESDQQSDD